ncbi:hypothetical protein JX266_006065 [Neoarthrinium moseri]|nr:hypothetical protein JX266_006065 [Neoarthrinium moseri]
MEQSFASLSFYGGIALLVVYPLAQIFYNLFLHPLRDVPGPLLARATDLWLFANELEGHVHDKILKLHHKLGSFSEVYCQGTKFDKARYFYNAFVDQADNLFTMTDRDQHSHDKRLMSHAFSKTTILQQESVIYDFVQQLVGRMMPFAQSGKEFPLLAGYRCMTLDLITEFVFGATPKAIESEDLNDPIIDQIGDTATGSVVTQHIPFVRKVLRFLSKNKITIPGFPDPVLNLGLGIQLRDEHLIAEGILMIIAGTDTTAVTLSTATYHLIKNPEIFERLRQEVAPFMPNKDARPSFNDLDHLPLLDACLKEGMRLSSPVRSRLPRVVPKDGWTSHGRFYKPGTIVSSSPLYLHQEPKIFHDCEAFNPDRWLVSPEKKSEMLHYFQPFSRGSRQCIGQNLSTIEQKITLATIVARFAPVSVAKDTIEWGESSTNALPDTQIYATMAARDM